MKKTITLICVILIAIFSNPSFSAALQEENWINGPSGQFEEKTKGVNDNGPDLWVRPYKIPNGYEIWMVRNRYNCKERSIQELAIISKKANNEPTQEILNNIIDYPPPGSSRALDLAFLCHDFSQRYENKK